MENRLLVGVEAGGTKFVVGVGTGPHDLRRSGGIQTRTPEETLPDVISAIHELADGQKLDGIGVAAFGPVDVRPRSPNYGQILPSCPKLDWAGFNLIQAPEM